MTVAARRHSETAPTRRRGLHSAQILEAAAELFRTRGFANVGMKDIAAAVGVTAPAIYRHFPNKIALLRSSISTGLDEIEGVLTAPHGDLAGTLHALAVSATRRRDLWILLHRDVRHLPEEERRAMRERLASIMERLADIIAPTRPDLQRNDVYWLARAAIATLAAPSQYRQTLQRKSLPDALAAVSTFLCQTPSLEIASPHPQAATAGASPFSSATSRREELLATAARLFAADGYQSVSMDDIGAASDIAGPSLYHHFTGKMEILTAIFRRAVDWIELDRLRALRSGGTPRSMLDMLMRDYAALAVTHSELFLIFTHERVHLSPEEQRALGRAHQQFFDEWVALLRASRPELNEGLARVFVSSAMCVINDLSQSRRLREGPGFHERLARLAGRVLDTPDV